MKHKIEAVKRFHEAFKIGYRTTPKADLGDSKNKLRFDLMREENEEYFQAAQTNDLVEVADALGDMLYICLLYTSPSPRDLSTSRMPSSA